MATESSLTAAERPQNQAEDRNKWRYTSSPPIRLLDVTETDVPVPLPSELMLHYWQMTKSSKQKRKQKSHQRLL
jgi:hypothetical protein